MEQIEPVRGGRLRKTRKPFHYLRLRARQLQADDPSLKHVDALNQLAKECGYSHWCLVMRASEKGTRTEKPPVLRNLPTGKPCGCEAKPHGAVPERPSSGNNLHEDLHDVERFYEANQRREDAA